MTVCKDNFKILKFQQKILHQPIRYLVLLVTHKFLVLVLIFFLDVLEYFIVCNIT